MRMKPIMMRVVAFVAVIGGGAFALFGDACRFYARIGHGIDARLLRKGYGHSSFRLKGGGMKHHIGLRRMSDGESV